MIELSKFYKGFFTSRPAWDEFAQKHDLPSSASYANCFGNGSWNQAKIRLGVTEISRKRYTREELMGIALNHNEYFCTQPIWDKHAKRHGLPWSSSFKRVFKSWNKAKEEINKMKYKKVG